MTKPKNILVFRGTFNPVHKGHLYVVNEVLDFMAADYNRLGLFDELWILPTHGGHKPVVSDTHRLNMIGLAITDFLLTTIRLKVCTFEMDTRNTAGLYKTIDALHKYYQTYSFGLLMGLDQAVYIRNDRYSRDVVRNVQCVVRARSGYAHFDHGGDDKAWFKKDPHIYLRRITKDFDSRISSTRIREYIKPLDVNNIDPKKQLNTELTKSVQEYILSHKLYFNKQQKG